MKTTKTAIAVLTLLTLSACGMSGAKMMDKKSMDKKEMTKEMTGISATDCFAAGGTIANEMCKMKDGSAKPVK